MERLWAGTQETPWGPNQQGHTDMAASKPPSPAAGGEQNKGAIGPATCLPVISLFLLYCPKPLLLETSFQETDGCDHGREQCKQALTKVSIEKRRLF